LAPNGSWRAGGYATFAAGIDIGSGSDAGSYADDSAAQEASRERPVIHAYSEATSLNRVAFFGLGPNTRDAGRSFFGIREIRLAAEVYQTSQPRAFVRSAFAAGCPALQFRAKQPLDRSPL
jgi:hypothetical protein